jgi:drug/metabolite transporter (DMT)-like permease
VLAYDGAMRKSPIILWGALSTTITLWASAFVGIRLALQAYSPGEVAFLRYFVASIAMLVFYLYLPQRQKVSLRELPALFIMGVMGIGIYNVALNYGEITVSAGISSFIIGLMPVVTMIMAIIFLQEHIRWRNWLGVAISIIGMLCIFLSSLSQDHNNSVAGIAEVFIATLMGSSYTIMQKRYLKKYHPIEITSFAIWGGTLMMAFYAPGVVTKLPNVSAWLTLDIVYMGVFPGAIAYVFWCFGLQHLPASRAVSILYVLPLLTTAMGYLALSEKPHWLALVGGFIGLLGAAFANSKR